jgi:hypothetical protein
LINNDPAPIKRTKAALNNDPAPIKRTKAALPAPSMVSPSVGQFEPGSLGREPDWQAMVIDHLKMNAGPATFGAQVQAARGLLGWTRDAMRKSPAT